MSREIKFRAWDKKTKAMFVPTRINLWLLNELSKYSDGSGTVSSKDSVLMQYTGLKDKNGKEIYEGDIVKTTYFDHARDVFTVVYWTSAMKFAYQSKNSGDYYGSNMEVEVIGNIYENPELLTT